MKYALKIKGEGTTPEGIKAARQAYVDALRAQLGSDAEIERCFAAWDRTASALWERGETLDADTQDAKKYLAAIQEAGYAAAECLPEALFLDFNFYLLKPK